MIPYPVFACYSDLSLATTCVACCRYRWICPGLVRQKSLIRKKLFGDHVLTMNETVLELKSNHDSRSVFRLAVHLALSSILLGSRVSMAELDFPCRAKRALSDFFDGKKLANLLVRCVWWAGLVVAEELPSGIRVEL